MTFENTYIKQLVFRKIKKFNHKQVVFKKIIFRQVLETSKRLNIKNVIYLITLEKFKKIIKKLKHQQFVSRKIILIWIFEQ